MKTVEITRAKGSLSQYARASRKGPLILTLDGKPFAALVGLPNADEESVNLSTNAAFLALIERSRLRLRKEGGVSATEMRRRLAAKRASARGRR